MSIPVLFLVFNRPEHTRQALAAILEQEPARLYVSGDGPRIDQPEDAALIRQVWQIIEESKYDCPVFGKRSVTNLGCFRAVSGGLDWFFSHESEGLIVEDDVLLAPGSLRLVARMLEHARDELSIGSVSAFSGVPLNHISEPNLSCRASIYSSSQAWGTWRDRWLDYQRSFVDWRDWLTINQLAEFGNQSFVRHWSRFFDRQMTNFTNSWDYLWLASNWANGRVHLIANHNHSKNIGFDAKATFSHLRPSWYPTDFDSWNDDDWTAPLTLAPDDTADQWLNKNAVGISASKRIKRAISGLFPSLYVLYRKAIEN